MAKETPNQKLRKEIDGLQNKFNQLEGERDGLVSQITEIKNLHTQELEQKEASCAIEKQNIQAKYVDEIALQKEGFDQEKSAWDSKELELAGSVKQRDQIIKKQQKQLNDHELKKMAQAYGNQEGIYQGDVNFWEKVLGGIVLALVISTAVSICLANGKPWYDRFEFYLVDFIFLSAVWFSASQYSYYIHLRSDYANRKTIAQSYHNILLSIDDEHADAENTVSKEIKERFIEKATDVLCAPSFTNIREPLLTKELVKNVTEITKGLSGK